MDHNIVETRHAREMMLKILLLLLICLATGMIFYHIVEDFSWLNSLYFSAMTLTTVGYGDLTPITDAGKLFTTIYAFLGIGMFFGFANALFRSTIARSMRRTLRKHAQAQSTQKIKN